MLRFQRPLRARRVTARRPVGANPCCANVIFLEEDAAVIVRGAGLRAPSANGGAGTTRIVDRRGRTRVEARHTALVGAQGGRRRAIAVRTAGLVRRDADLFRPGTYPALALSSNVRFQIADPAMLSMKTAVY